MVFLILTNVCRFNAAGKSWFVTEESRVYYIKIVVYNIKYCVLHYMSNFIHV